MNITFKKSVISTEPVSEEVTAMVDGVTIAASTGVVLLREAGHSPVFYFPLADVRRELLVPTDRTSRCPLKGEANYYSIALPTGRVIDNAVWQYAQPKGGLDELSDRVAFYPNLVALKAG